MSLDSRTTVPMETMKMAPRSSGHLAKARGQWAWDMEMIFVLTCEGTFELFSKLHEHHISFYVLVAFLQEPIYRTTRSSQHIHATFFLCCVSIIRVCLGNSAWSGVRAHSGRARGGQKPEEPFGRGGLRLLRFSKGGRGAKTLIKPRLQTAFPVSVSHCSARETYNTLRMRHVESQT